MPFRIRIFLSIFLALFVLLAIGPFLIPLPELENTVPAESLAAEAGSFIEVDGVRLHVREAGNGPAAYLLLHGYPANVESWRKILPELALYGRVVAVDRIGFGLSDRPLPGSWSRGDNPYLAEAQLERALAVLDRLGIDQAVWIGSSSGAIVALQAALERPERVAALVLVGAPAYGGRSPPRWLRPLLHTPQMDRVGPLLMRQLGGPPGMNLFASQWTVPERIGSDDISSFRRTFEVEDWDRALWEVSKASRPADVDRQLADVDVPTLVVAGAQDEIVPPDESERLARELPRATLGLMEDCGHLPHEECPSAFMDVVSDWLSTLAEPAGR
ncbi:MAG: alpha/beta hydrolase [Trueperaceae bacterium]